MITITNPFHGAVLTHQNGRETHGGLEIAVGGLADDQGVITVNGMRAQRDGAVFRAPVTLSNRETEIVAAIKNTRGEQRHTVRVLWDPTPIKRYGFFIDDNCFFLTDIVQKQYRSIFDCFYLEKLRSINQRYGVKFVLNLFYRNDHNKNAAAAFTLDQFPDTYRGEWANHANWLKLAFHAYSEFPDRPYQYAVPEKLAADYDLVKSEIVRFAGEQSFCPPTVIHWGMISPGCFAVLSQRGVTMLVGAFIGARTAVGQKEEDGVDPDIGYFLDRERSELLRDHSVLYDFEKRMLFVRGDLCCNLDTQDQIKEKIERKIANPHFNDFISFATHEQYSFPYYMNFIPDHFERIELAVRLAAEHGYRPVFHHEAFV